MKKLIYALVFTIFIFNVSKAQTISETEIFKNTTGTTFQPYNLIYDKAGNWAFLQNDTTDPNVSRARIVSNKFTSDVYENLTDPGKYDSHGNLYSSTYKLKSDGSYETDYYTLLVNGVPFGNFETLDPYDATINADGDYEFVYSKLGDYYIGKISNGVLIPSANYKMVKYTYKAYSGNDGNDRGEGDGVKGDIANITDDDTPPIDQLFRDASGNIGYILLTDNNASIIFGSNITETNFKDINESSFQYDNNKDMVYIGKDRTDYSYQGFQTLVMKNNKYMVHGMINSPIVFMSDNTPVFTATDSLNETTYLYKVYKGDKEQPVYRDAGKTKKFAGFNSSITDLSVDNGKIIYTGTNYTVGKKSEKFPEGEYTTKGSLVIDGVMGPELENVSMIKRSTSGKYLYSYMPDHNKPQYALFYGSMSSPEKVGDKSYDYYTDYDFIKGTDRFYAIASKDGNYDKGTPGRSYVYIDNKLVGDNELVISTNSLTPNDYSVIRFAPNDDYAYAGGKSTTDNMWIYNVYTKSGVAKADMSSVPGLTEFNSVDYIYFTPSSKLFYIGGVNDSQSLNYSMKNYIVYDGKVLDKYYDMVQDLKYNSSDNSITFKGTRDNSVYNVKVSL